MKLNIYSTAKYRFILITSIFLLIGVIAFFLFFKKDQFLPPQKIFCNTEKEYLKPVSCKCPEGYEFERTMGWGKCPKPEIRDCPVSYVKCVKIKSKLITTEEEAISAVKKKYPEVQNINTSNAQIGKSMDIRVKKDEVFWKLEFWQGSGDCPAGCINDHYWYFTVSSTEEIQKIGEYERIYNSKRGSYDEKGFPLWDFLK